MARAYTKCNGKCKGLLWFADTDIAPQAIICDCRETTLTEDGPRGNHTPLSAEELESLP